MAGRLRKRPNSLSNLNWGGIDMLRVREGLLSLGLTLLLGFTAAGPLAAAEKATIAPSTYKKLTKIQEQMANGQWQVAIDALKLLHDKVSDTSVDQAIVLQTWGFAEVSANHYKRAVALFERSLATTHLPDAAALSVRFMLAQLYAAQGNYAKALSVAEVWIKSVPAPSPTQHIFMANLLARNKRFAAAISHAEAAIRTAEAPKAVWYQLLLAAHFELRHYPQAAQVLQAMIAHWPDDARYWEQLASVYMLRKQASHALATLQIAWRRGLLDKDATLKSLVQLAVSRGVPERAARLLDQALEKQLLPPDQAFLKMLADAWSLARENQQAIDALARLAAVSSDGEPWLRQARIHLELGDWPAARGALDKALERGVKVPGKAWLLLGIAEVESQDFSAADTALRKAQAFPDQAKQASAWLDYAADRRRQVKRLAQNNP